jgi:ATP-dependent Zn protease
MVEKSVEHWVHWEPCHGKEGAEALVELSGTQPAYFVDSTLVSARWSRLSFYTAHRLMELLFVRDHGEERAFVLAGPADVLWLDGSSDPIHQVNESEPLEFSEQTVVDYIRFFFYFVRGDGGAFALIESPDELGAPADDSDGRSEDQDEVLTLKDARQKVKPLLLRSIDTTGWWLADATVAYDGVLFVSSVAVRSDGTVEMIEDDAVGELGGITVPEVASLELQEHVDEAVAATREPGLGSSGGSPGDREVTEAVVAVLLEDAIRDLNNEVTSGNPLLRHFNSETQAAKPIDQLTRLMTDSQPIVIIESDIPFVEDFVAGLAAPGDTAARFAVRASAVQNDDLRCEISLNERCKLYLLSFHTYRGLFDAERVAHDLALSEAAVLIGCNRVDDVPEPLRRVADLTITFPPIDRRRFARIFERVFHAKPTIGWDAPGADWTRYLVPADFHTPRRLGLDPDDALSLLKERIQVRLEQVTPDIGLRLSELHGLGEARQIAEDLIEDIRDAQAGQIPWSAVDSGLLLIGAPGTGKTTLARAIAKDCGVKFVVASAAKWQSAGALDAHLRAMRADFAEAHRYAPAILFLDEIDSIGSRENLTDTNALYQTEVINALLEEIQGINTTDSVIVIGATNYLERVDPALRRAGRLDQIVEIPLPNVDSLQHIFTYYIAQYEADGGEVADIDARALAQLTFGLTGADVESFIRGAARRARHEDRPVGQIDLVAEVTRRPRHPDSAPRLGPEEIHRVAVHEAGHTVAQLLSSTQGKELVFASIIPRMNGSLGFVAAMPADTQVLTRRTMLERLETVLAGRAAEEVVFGAADVGAGAGGPDQSSDLAVATRLATLIVCQSGLGDHGGLRWTTQPTAAQVDQIDDLLRNSYAEIRASLQTQRPLLDRVAQVLEEKQELSGNELRQLVSSSTLP